MLTTHILWKTLNFIHLGLSVINAFVSAFFPERALTALQLPSNDPTLVLHRSLFGIFYLQLTGFYYFMTREEDDHKITLYARFMCLMYLIMVGWGYYHLHFDLKNSKFMEKTVYSWIFYLFCYFYFAFIQEKEKIE